MAKRPGITSLIRSDADGGTPPNNYIAAVTAEVRVHWPPRATAEEVEAALQEAVDQARAKIAARMAEAGRDMRYPERRPGWLGTHQPWPCGRCGRQEDDSEKHDCQPATEATDG